MNEKKLLKYGKDLVASALKAGATDAQAHVSAGDSEEVRVRNGSVELVSRESGVSLSLYVLVGKREGSSSCESLSASDILRTAAEAVAIAKVSTENPFASIAKANMWPCPLGAMGEKERALDRVDDSGRSSIKQLTKEALDLDQLLLDQEGVSKTEIVQVSQSRSMGALCNSAGFLAAKESTSFGRYASAVAEAKDGEMHSGGDGDGAIYLADLRSAEECAQRAAYRARSLLGAKPIPTARMPVIFDRDISPSLLQVLYAAIRGGAVYDKSTFLLGKIGAPIFRRGVYIIEDPFIPRGMKSRLCDSETVRAGRYAIINDGVLTMWTTTIESGAKLKLTSTGHANGPSNVVMYRGMQTKEQMISGITRGLLVTELMGHGPNIVTGDYSAGAAGILIEHGELTRPVNEVTIAGNLLEMFRTLTPASDMSENSGTNAPSCLVDEMTVAGS
ncbi:MAG: metallopeptidase TldD-related protein [bacterium]|nr:metallopeptidase TldD-related protein [bacterium]